MKITTTTSPDYDEPSIDGSITIELKTDTDYDSINFGHGEPEDNYLSRDLNDVYSIVPMLKMAYEAGKRGEAFELVEEKEEE